MVVDGQTDAEVEIIHTIHIEFVNIQISEFIISAFTVQIFQGLLRDHLRPLIFRWEPFQWCAVNDFCPFSYV